MKKMLRQKKSTFSIRILATLFLLSLLHACSLSLNMQQPVDHKLQKAGYSILFGGDFCFGDTYQQGFKIIEQYGYDYSMNGVAPFLDGADFSIVNLETPITAVDIKPYLGLKRWVHRGDLNAYPRYMKKHRIDAVSLANNHTADCGAEGLLETLRVLDTHSILRVGAGLNDTEATAPLIREISIGKNKFKLAVFTAYEDRSKIALASQSVFAFAERPGVNLLTPEKIAEGIRDFKDKNPDGFAVVFPHWGINYAWKSSGQAALARELIDAGADIIIGHGAHMLQEIEQYRGKWIIYSLGNFVFNTPGRYERENAWPYSAIAILSFVPGNDGLNARIRLYPILTDNLVTHYQTRPVDEKEFKKIIELLTEKNKVSSASPEGFTQARDHLGFYLEGVIF